MVGHYNYHKPATSIVPPHGQVVNNYFFTFFANSAITLIYSSTGLYHCIAVLLYCGEALLCCTLPLYCVKVVGLYNYLFGIVH